MFISVFCHQLILPTFSLKTPAGLIETLLPQCHAAGDGYLLKNRHFSSQSCSNLDFIIFNL
jgi:hypothetical protein